MGDFRVCVTDPVGPLGSPSSTTDVWVETVGKLGGEDGTQDARFRPDFGRRRTEVRVGGRSSIMWPGGVRKIVINLP